MNQLRLQKFLDIYETEDIYMVQDVIPPMRGKKKKKRTTTKFRPIPLSHVILKRLQNFLVPC